MAIPRQRKGGQTGGRGGMFDNRGRSVSRGGSPSRGGGGTGKKPPGGCLILIPTCLYGIAVVAVSVWELLA